MRKVFWFTAKEASRGKSFLITTIGVPILLFLVGLIAIGLVSYVQIKDSKEDNENKLETVYVVNETEYNYFDFSGMKEPKVVVSDKTADEVREDIYKSKESDALVTISEKKDTLGLTMILTDNFEGDEDEGQAVLDTMQSMLQQSKLFQSGISQESLAVIVSPVDVSYTTVGEEPEEMGVSIVKIFAPMIFILALYFMVLIYGQSIAKTVSAEKTSKLMETLLLTVKPFDLMGGKVFAMASVGFLQFALWLVGLALGLVSGHYVGLLINPNFDNPLVGVLNGLRQLGAGTAFTWPAVVLGMLALCVGFTFYCVLAGLIASRISRAEDLGQGMGSFQVAVIIGFFGAYFPQMQGKASLLALVRWFPLTSAFSLPGDILIGNVNLLSGGLMLAALIAETLVLIWVAGKMYRNQVFYRR